MDNKQETQWRAWVRKKIDFYISTGKWDNVTIPQLNVWLANFDYEGQKYALALLNHVIYYSEIDLKRLCQYALTNIVFKFQLLDFDKSNGFQGKNELLSSELKNRIDETKIIPVLSKGNPTESGNAIARMYTTTDLVDETKILRPDQLISYIYRGSCKRFLFVDDFLGSGDQLDSFWNGSHIPVGAGGERESLSVIAEKHPTVSFEYLALVATTYGLQNIKHLTSKLKIHFCEELSDEYRVFSENSIFFPNPEERQACEKYLNSLCNVKKIKMRGWHDLDYAIAFHHGTPDSCLPIFWDENRNWTRLFRCRM